MTVLTNARQANQWQEAEQMSPRVKEELDLFLLRAHPFERCMALADLGLTQAQWLSGLSISVDEGAWHDTGDVEEWTAPRHELAQVAKVVEI